MGLFGDKKEQIPDIKCPNCGATVSGWRDKFYGDCYSCFECGWKTQNFKR